MNNKEEIENYFLELYKKTKNYSFEKFLETVFHYNIQIGNYNKPIFFDLQKCTLDILKEINTIKPEIKYWNSFGWNNVFVIFNKYFTYYNKIVLDFPIFDYDIDKICPTIIKYIIFNGITSKISFHNVNKNPLFKIEIYNIDDVNKIINFFYSNNKISSITKSRVIPLLIQKNYIGIYREYDPFDFKNYYLSKLFEFYNICLEEKDVKISKFRDYLSKIYRFER